MLAYCEAVCEPQAAVLAAAEAFARFRAAVAAADDPGGLSPEPLLLSATRHAAASLARNATSTGRNRAIIGRRRSGELLCPRVPELLAQRADDMLGPADLDALAHHLESDAACREIEAAFRRAERAYRAQPERPVAAGARDIILAALVAAAPVADADEQFDPPLVDVVIPPDAQTPARADFADPEDLIAPDEDDDLDAEEALEDDGPEAPLDDAEDHLPAYEDQHDAEPLADDRQPVLSPWRAVDVPAVTTPWSRDHAPAAAAARGLPRRSRVHLPHVDHGPVFGFVLPAAALTVALIIILAIAGVFGGDGPAPGLVLAPLRQLG